MPAGRPSEYDAAYCKEAEAFLSEGFSVAALAGKLGVAKQTIYNWIDAHPEFMDAVKVGQAKAVLWWEERNRHMAVTGEGNATLIVFGLKNRASDEWRESKSTEISGPNGGPINLRKADLSDDELAAIATGGG
jgi:transposase